MQQMTSRIAFLDYMRVFAFASVLIGHKFFNPIFLASIESPNVLVRSAARLALPFIEAGGAW